MPPGLRICAFAAANAVVLLFIAVTFKESFDRSTSSRLRTNGRGLIPLPDLRFVVSLLNHEWNQLTQMFNKYYVPEFDTDLERR
jgi:hypothetical protein